MSLFPEQTLSTWFSICRDVSENTLTGIYQETSGWRDCVFLDGRGTRAQQIYVACWVLSAHPCFLYMKNRKSENICFMVYLIRGQKSKQNMEKQQWGVRFQLDSERQGRWTPFISCSFSFISVQPWLSVFVRLTGHKTTVCVLLSLHPLKPVLDMCLCCDLCMS